MLLEKQNRTKNNLFIKNEFKNIDRKIIIFLITFFINLLTFNNEPILMVTPFLILGYLLGFSYLIIVIMASFIGSVIFSPLSFYTTCLFIVLFLISVILLRFVKMRVQIRMLIGSYISDLLARYIFEIGIKNELTLLPLFYSVLSLILSILVVKISEYLLNEEKKQYPYLIVLNILIIASLALLGLDYEIKEISILFIVLSIFYLFCSKILDFSIYGCFLFVNLIFLLFLKKLDNTQLFLLFIPCLLTNLDKRKYLNLLIYLLSSVILILFFNLNFNLSLLITYFLISLAFMAIPSLFINHLKESIMNPVNDLDLYEKKYQKKEKEIEQELNKFSNLFSLVVQEYDNDNEKRLQRKKEDVMYHSLCINCHKNKGCFTKDNTLKNLMFKSIESEISEEEILYINKECLKPSKFLEFSELFKRDYYKEYKYNLEYQGLKEALKSQLKGLNLVLNQYSNKLKLDNSLYINYENELIKDILDKNQFDVLYVNYFEDYKGNIGINLCVKVTSNQDVHKIKEIISNELNINLDLGTVSHFSLDGFLKIELKEIKEYKFIHGIHQINLKQDGNGDSYLVYENNNYMIYSLSDGMGAGKEAKEESRFTLKILKSILDTGMDLKNGIILMNSLLKVKNRYETYATLDLVSINKKNLKSHFFKNGAMHSYIYSALENRLTKINSSSLPIGIVDKVNSFDFSFKLRNNDYILMFSDGIKENEDVMEAFFKQVKDYNPQIIAREIAMHFKNDKELDDVSVLVIKIEK